MRAPFTRSRTLYWSQKTAGMTTPAWVVPRHSSQSDTHAAEKGDGPKRHPTRCQDKDVDDDDAWYRTCNAPGHESLHTIVMTSVEMPERSCWPVSGSSQPRTRASMTALQIQQWRTTSRTTTDPNNYKMRSNSPATVWSARHSPFVQRVLAESFKSKQRGAATERAPSSPGTAQPSRCFSLCNCVYAPRERCVERLCPRPHWPPC